MNSAPAVSAILSKCHIPSCLVHCYAGEGEIIHHGFKHCCIICEMAAPWPGYAPTFRTHQDRIDHFELHHKLVVSNFKYSGLVKRIFVVLSKIRVFWDLSKYRILAENNFYFFKDRKCHVCNDYYYSWTAFFQHVKLHIRDPVTGALTDRERLGYTRTLRLLSGLPYEGEP